MLPLFGSEEELRLLAFSVVVDSESCASVTMKSVSVGVDGEGSWSVIMFDMGSNWLDTPHTRLEGRIISYRWQVLKIRNDRISASLDRKFRYFVVGDSPVEAVFVDISRLVNGKVVLKLRGFQGSRLLHTTHKGENLK